MGCKLETQRMLLSRTRILLIRTDSNDRAIGWHTLHPKALPSVVFDTASFATAWNLLPPGTPMRGVLVTIRPPLLSVSALCTSFTGMLSDPATKGSGLIALSVLSCVVAASPNALNRIFTNSRSGCNRFITHLDTVNCLSGKSDRKGFWQALITY